MSAVIPTEWQDVFAVTPSDDDDLPKNGVTGLRAATAGVIVVDVPNGGTAVPVPVVAGVDLHLPVKRVRSTNTTATGIVALIGR
jgi:hypothetical protein